MKNFVSPGDTFPFTAGGTILAGAGVLLGSIFGVAAAGYASGEAGQLKVTGTYDLPKVGSQAWTVGQLVYWTGSACTNVASTNKLIGAAVLAVGSGAGETTGRVRLNGAAITA